MKRLMKSGRYAVLVLVAVFIAACGADADADPELVNDALAPETTIAATTTTTTTTMPPTTTTTEAPAWTFVGVDGVETTITDTTRLVPLSGSINETVFALGFGSFVVGNDITALYPPESADVEKIGHHRRMSAEGVLALNPSLVIGNESAGPPEVLELLRGAGVPVVILPSETTVDGAVKSIIRIGTVLGVPDLGEELALRVQAEIDAAKDDVPADRVPARVAFVYARGLDVLFLAGSDTAANSLITTAGAVDVGAESGVEGFVSLTAEGLVAANPDVLIILERGMQSLGGVEGLLEIPGVAQTQAGRDRNFLTFDDLKFHGLTPRVGEALQELVDALYPAESS